MEQDQAQARSFQEKSRDFLKKNGFFVVLGLCALCILIAVLSTIGPANEALPDATPDAAQTRLSQDERLVSLSPAPTATPEPDTGTAASAQVSAPEPAATSKPASAPKAPGKYPAPATGSVVFGYADDTLLYSKTLEQWMTHEGVDIAVKEGTPVKAIRAGTVQSVYMDDALGAVVTVAHEEGFLSLYGNLQENPPVAEGQKVESGDTLGLTGNTAISECALEPHVHFALYKGGAPVDPYQHILLEK